MMGENLTLMLRDAKTADIPAIVQIYDHYVRTSITTFEEEPPDAAEIERRFARVVGLGLPWLAVEDAEGLRGYAYAAPYRDRSAYRYSVENSIYIDPAATGRGYGAALLEALIQRCTSAGKRQMIAVIVGSTAVQSIGLHSRLGFRVAGVIPSVGFKMGCWADTVIMARGLGEGDTTSPV